MSVCLDYDKLIPLDAETLAETGIKEAYCSILPELSQHLESPAEVRELIENEAPSYVVECQGVSHTVYTPEDESRSWGRATHAFFDIVNNQMQNSEYRFYAINGGNELGGMFLTPHDCEESRKSIPRKEDWPYLPTLEHPWYGQCHD